ncbi:hypothetical protein GOP47_0000694 [Adiantum capillus-veneris]|uniref:PPM-type phosphatase domain-containing protein n=1 Tax=Adiantum capillus-veneris TaxID=13818 RepID=A0A9D4VDG6_ADICA|nr:hypothetical protein GOP47_0000694 [Adiantum capillus-veneris]
MGVCMSIDEQSLHTRPLRGKKKIVIEMLNAEAKVTEILSRMPSRICTDGSTFSACAFSKQGRKGINQDCMLVWEEFAAQADLVFCGVFDGHGPNGHLVARKVRDTLPVLLALPHSLLANEVDNLDPDEDVYIHEECQQEEDVVLKIHEQIAATNKANVDPSSDNQPATKACCDQTWRDKFVAAYKLMDRNLKSHPKLHCFESGTTAVTMVLQGKDLIIGNVGDSRAILARRSQENGSLVAHQLTTDLKPNLPMELERIKRCKGRVFALEDEPNVARVWSPHSDMPGLAMARALGDFCLKEYGLSATPQIFCRRLTEEDEFIVLASDGIWDVLSNEDVARIVASAFPKETAAKALVDTAVRAWKIKHGTWRTDDCTAICYFIKEKLIPTFSVN